MKWKGDRLCQVFMLGFQMVGALADADDMSMSGIVYFLWVFSRNCCLFWFLFGNLCIFTGLSHLLRFSFSLLGLWIFLTVFIVVCKLFYPSFYGLWSVFEGVLNPFLPSTHLCSLPASSHSLLLSFLFTMNVICPFSWIKKKEESPGFHMYC